MSTRMAMATNRQRFRVTFSHGFSVWLRLWMDGDLGKDAAANSEASGAVANGGEECDRLTASGKARLPG